MDPIDKLYFYDYSMLPHMIIQQIFTHLSQKDIKASILTCKSWYCVSLHPKFTESLTFSLNETSATALRSMNRKYSKIEINYYKFTNPSIAIYFTKFGEHIQKLCLHKCRITMNQVVRDILKYLTNLDTLEIDDDANIFNFKTIFGCKTTADDLAIIERNLSNIKRLGIVSRNMNYDMLEEFLSKTNCLESLKFEILSGSKSRTNFEHFWNILSRIDIIELKYLSIIIRDEESIVMDRIAKFDISKIKLFKLNVHGAQRTIQR